MVPKSKTHNKNSKMLVTSLSSSHQEDLGGSAALDIVRYYVLISKWQWMGSCDSGGDPPNVTCATHVLSDLMTTEVPCGSCLFISQGEEMAQVICKLCWLLDEALKNTKMTISRQNNLRHPKLDKTKGWLKVLHCSIKLYGKESLQIFPQIVISQNEKSEP